MSAFDEYRAWERNPVGKVHVMQINRGDESAANRLTLTDRPYVDKGVSGTKYHDTYPAPIQCITSDLVTHEDFKATRFDDIVLSNATGKLDGILDQVIIGKEYSIYRGATDWSILETDLPNRFQLIARGRIDAVIFEKSGKQVRLKVIPIIYKLDQTMGSRASPVAFGNAFNVPAVLGSSASTRYDFSSVPLTPNAPPFVLREDGLELDEGIVSVGDYTLNADDGSVSLYSAPSGTLTADLLAQEEATSDVFNQIAAFITRYLTDDNSLLEKSTSVIAAEITGVTSRIYIKKDGTKLFAMDIFNHVIHQFSFGTALDADTLSYDSVSKDLSADVGSTVEQIHITDDGMELYLTDPLGIYQFSFSTAWDISTLSYSGALGYGVGSTSDKYQLYVAPTKDFFFFVNRKILYRAEMTGGDITTGTNRTLVTTLESDSAGDNIITGIDFSADGLKFYWSAKGRIHQLDLIEAYDFDGHFPPGRAYYDFGDADLISASGYGGAGFRVFDEKFFMLSGLSVLRQFNGITGSNLPIAVLAGKYSVTSGGAFYNSETRKGQILNDLCTCLGCGYYISRLGSITLTQEIDPASIGSSYMRTTSENIYFRDFIGDRGSHIQHSKTLGPAISVTVEYKKNYSPQPGTVLDASLTQDEKDAFAAPYQVVTDSQTLTNYVDPEEVVYRSHCSDQTSAEAVRDTILAFRATERFYFNWKTTLGWTTALSEFGIGSVITVNGDIKHDFFSDGDEVLVVGRKVNWSKDTQTLEVMK